VTDTGSYAGLPERLTNDPEVAIVVDTCDLRTGRVRQVIARGAAQVVPLDVDRARRKLVRYLGADETRWDERFTATLRDPDTRLVRLEPRTMRARDLSYLSPDAEI
jgi:hypothetical protein